MMAERPPGASPEMAAEGAAAEGAAAEPISTPSETSISSPIAEQPLVASVAAAAGPALLVDAIAEPPPDGGAGDGGGAAAAAGGTEDAETLTQGVTDSDVESLMAAGFVRERVVGWLYFFRDAEAPMAEAVTRLLDGDVPPPVMNENARVASLLEMFAGARVKPTEKAAKKALTSCRQDLFEGVSPRYVLRIRVISFSSSPRTCVYEPAC